MPRTAATTRATWNNHVKTGRVRPSNVAKSHWCPSCGDLLDGGKCATCGHGHPTDLEYDAFDAPAGEDD